MAEEEQMNGLTAFEHRQSQFSSSRNPGEDTKLVCWDLDQRGGVGEHILHICFLSSSPVHSALAKRLLRYYPKMIDDLYMGDEYYGS